MTREELKVHCERQIQQFERVEKLMPVTPNDCRRYEEHKMVLELLEREQPTLDKIRTEIEEYRDSMRWNSECLIKWEAINYVLEEIIDKYRMESEKVND